MNKTVLELACKVAKKVAYQSNGTRSSGWIYEPKIPQSVKKMKNNK